MDSTPRTYAAGRWTFRVDRADVRAIRVGGREIIRRIAVTVRDPAWREIPPVSWTVTADPDGARGSEVLRLRIAADYDDGPIAFRWHGVLELDGRSGRGAFHVAGRAARGFDVNRLGLTVTHPAEELVGGELRSSGPDGASRVAATRRLLPQPIVAGLPSGITPPFDELETRFADGAAVTFAFTGPLFEIEDQRNFADSSFKSYCPPLGGGFPYPIAADTAVELGVAWHAEVPDDDRAAPVIRARGALPRVLTAPDREGWTLVTGHLADLNRGEPVDLTGPVDLTICPAIHSGDALTLAENVPAVREMLETATELLPGSELALTLTFRQGPEPEPDAFRIAGPWAVAAIASLAGGAATRVTLAEDLAGAVPADALAALDAARDAGDAEYEADVHALRHRLRWADGRGELTVDLAADPADAITNRWEKL